MSTPFRGRPKEFNGWSSTVRFTVPVATERFRDHFLSLLEAEQRPNIRFVVLVTSANGGRGALAVVLKNSFGVLDPSKRKELRQLFGYSGSYVFVGAANVEPVAVY